MPAGHGINVGYGFTKIVVIDGNGKEKLAVTRPSMIGRAEKQVAGALGRAETVNVGGVHWWTGEDALMARTAITKPGQERLSDPYFIPAMVRGAMNGQATSKTPAICVSGLPATWAQDPEMAKALGQRIREAREYEQIRVIPEPLALLYALVLDNHGAEAGDTQLMRKKILVLDLGHHTDDAGIIDAGRPVRNSLTTFQTGMSRPLAEMRATMTALYERDFSLFEVDAAYRAGSVEVAGATVRLPADIDQPVKDNGSLLVTKLRETFGKGNDLYAVVVGGGGAEATQKADAIREAYRQTVVVERAQLAIALGYARLARRLGGAE